MGYCGGPLQHSSAQRWVAGVQVPASLSQDAKEIVYGKGESVMLIRYKRCRPGFLFTLHAPRLRARPIRALLLVPAERLSVCLRVLLCSR